MSNKVVDILMERDGLTEQEARDLMAETMDDLLSGNSDAIMDNLGLEDDYIFDLFF